MIMVASWACAALSWAILGAGQSFQEPQHFFREQIGLSDAQIASIASGRPVVKVLPSHTAAEIIIFGAVFVNATPEEYVRLAFDVERLRSLPGYLGAGRFHEPPALANLEGFGLESEDIRSLRSCRPGRCGIQLPAQAMREMQESLDWSGPDVAAQVNSRVRRMALDVLQRYQRAGNSILGTYHDADNPFNVNGQLDSLLRRSAALPVYLPDLNRFLLEYPHTELANVESLFYWERVNFGMKPTLRLNHAIAYRSSGPRGEAQVVAVKQLYASHYFQLALDLTACVRGDGRPVKGGFYLISLKGSTQQGFSGFRGSLLRRIVVARARAAQEKVLAGIKQVLEERQGRVNAGTPGARRQEERYR